MEKIVAVVSLMVASVVVVLASSHPAQAGDEKKPEALVSPPLSINPTEGQPICLVSNVGVSTSVSVTVDIIDATGATVVSNQIELPPGGIEAATDVLGNFYSYCRITPANAAHVALLRGSHCTASGNSVKVCVEAR